MTIYSIIPRPDRAGFDVSVISLDGSRETAFGFETEAAAEAWIRQNSWQTGATAG